MRYVVTDKVPVIFQKDLPAISEYGFSVYMGVIVRWDEDYDSRVLTFIKNLPKSLRARLIAVAEYEGTIALLWRGEIIPRGYEPCNQVEVEGDYWHVVSSVTLGEEGDNK